MSIKDFNKQTVTNLTFEAATRPIAPTISGYTISGSDDTALDPAGGQTILVNGSGFRPGATITMNNTSISVVTFVSVDQLSFTSPAMSAGTYNLFVVNTDNGAAILAPGIVYSTFPTWTTAQGTLGSYYETTSINETVEATGDAPIVYTLVSGSLPSGASLASDGTITGTSPIDNSSTTYTFTVQADDAESQSSTREFSLTINTDVVTWVAPTSGATITLDGTSYSQALSATDAAGYSVSYTANALPTGLTLSSGTISGTATAEGTSTTLLTATAATTNRSANNTITWVVSLGDVYWKNVSLLLSGSTPTPTFINDASLNNNQLSIVGDTKPNNFNPYETGYYSNYFNGSTYVNIPVPGGLGAGDFTVEGWVYFTVSPGNNGVFQIASSGYLPSNSTNSVALAGNGAPLWHIYLGSISTTQTGATILTNQWYHYAICRASGSSRLFINGTQVQQTYTDSTDYTSSTYLSLGGYYSSSYLMTGYISNFRILRGTALYTTTFAIPTAPLTPVSNTQVLVAQSNRLIDNSVGNNAVTVATGNTQISPAHPFTTPTTAAYNTRYSVEMKGSGNYVSIPGGNNDFAFGTEDLTIEGWVYWKSGTAFTLFDNRSSVSSVNIAVTLNTASISVYIGGSNFVINGSTFTTRQWYHIAVVRIAGSMKLYINGTQSGSTYPSSQNFTSVSGPVCIGGGYPSGTNSPLVGYISNVRVVKGVGVYTGDFTVPISPLTAIQDAGTNISALTAGQTVLLTCQDSTGKDNSSSSKSVSANGTAQPVAVSPFTMTTSNTTVTSLGSAYFDGTGDYLSVTSNAGIQVGSSDFTFETWVYPTTFNANGNPLISFDTNASYYGAIRLGYDSGGTLFLFMSTNGTTFSINVTTGIGSVVLNTWTHVALTKSGTSVKIYVNGIQQGATQTLSSATLMTGTNYWIGYLNAPSTQLIYGYLSDYRLVKGTALYTSNFLPPQTPLTPVTNTALLTCQYNGGANNNGFVDQSSFNNIITRNGNPTQGTFSPFSQTGWSNYFNGSSTYYFPSSINLNPEAGAFTYEGWVNIPTGTNNKQIFVGGVLIGTGGYSGSTVGALRYYDGSSTFVSNASYLIATGTWNHFAIVREGTGSNQLKMYINGILVSVGTSTNNPGTATNYYVGSVNTSTDLLTGYISNFRFVKGTAVYTTDSTTVGTQIFTPPTTPLTAIPNTQLLIAQSSRIVDNSPNNFTPTISATPSVQAYSPFGGITSVPTSYSNYFDGTGDYLSVASGNSQLSLGTGDFTVEFWVYTRSTAAQSFFDNRSPDTANAGFDISLLASSNYLRFSTSGTAYIDGNNALIINQWSHIALTRTGNQFKLYINGSQTGSTYTGSSTQNFTNTETRIGSGQVGPMTGYISNFRIVKGTAITPPAGGPTSPLTAVSGTSLLTCQSNTIIDNSTNTFTITANGDTKTTPFNPFGNTNTTNVSYTPSVNGGSIYFDGTGDYLTVGTFAPRTADFTIDYWVYPTALPASGQQSITFGTPFDGNNFQMFINNDSTIQWQAYSAASAGAPIKINQWNHIAVTRVSSVGYLYINGVLANSASMGTDITGTATVGARGAALYLTGYITDMRTTIRSVLYTSNFYPSPVPASPTTTIGTTTYTSSLLLSGTSGGIIDYHGTNDLETIGNTQLASEDPYGGSYYSNYFDGTGDYLDVGTPMSLSGDFTIEMWFKPDAVSKTYADLFTSVSANFELGLNTNSLVFWDSGSIAITHQTIVTAGVWHHVALTRSGTTVYLYLDGVRSTTSATKSTTYVPYRIATYATETFPGFISNLRVVSGTVLYSGATITVPTTALTAISGTQLLTCQSNKFKDNSANNYSITVTGDVKVKSQNPFQQNTGKSLYFDGTGDYLQFPETPGAWYLGTNDFTIEGWVYPTARVSNGAYILARSQYGVNSDWLFNITSTGTLQFYMLSGGSSIVTSTGTVPLNQWTYIAVVRTTTTVKLYINGTNDGTLNGFSSALTISYGPTVVGNSSNNSGSTYFPGYIKDLRITKGVARTITVPITPLNNK